jgi:LL-diaminopimelate aminotransferase
MRSSGIHIIRLDIGSPDLPPAPYILEALWKSAKDPGSHGYQLHQGTRRLREAWANMYERSYSVSLDPDKEILPLLGSKEGIFHLTQAYVNPGDVVLVPDPGYLTYRMSAAFAGGETYPMVLCYNRDYLPDLESIPSDIARRARLLWINYPNNPTAAVASLTFFDEVIAFARKYDILVCHDSAYTQVVYNGYQAPSIFQVSGAKECAIEFNSLSKSHNLAGWRVGAVLGNPEVIHTLFKLKTQVDSGHFLPILEAATAAMNGDQTWIRDRNEIYRQRRDLAIDYLHRLGLMARSPQASLYIWCPVPEGWTSLEFADALLDQAHISVTPGTVFGQHGEGYIRLSLTNPVELINEAMERLVRWMSQ